MDREQVYIDFMRNTAEHQMEVVLDQDMHRHLRFRKPGTGCYGFDIVTWPGYLAISGDMGASVFTRVPDMFTFFRNEPAQLSINPPYWAEKCCANDGEIKKYRPELFREYVERRLKEHVEDHLADGDDMETSEWVADLREQVEDEVLSSEEGVSEAIGVMTAFESSPDTFNMRFGDAWESASQLTDYTFHFLWRLFAIVYAIKSYDKYKETT